MAETVGETKRTDSVIVKLENSSIHIQYRKIVVYDQSYPRGKESKICHLSIRQQICKEHNYLFIK